MFKSSLIICYIESLDLVSVSFAVAVSVLATKATIIVLCKRLLFRSILDVEIL